MQDKLPHAFRLLAGANLGAQSAEQLSLAAVPLVAVLALGAGAGEIGVLGAVQTLPFLLLSIPVGLLTDRLPRRSVMVAPLAVPTGVLAGLSFFLFGAGPIIWTITTTTLRQAITPGPLLGRVGSVFLTVNAGARPVGAGIGALVGGLWGEPACLWLALAGFVVQAAIIILAASMNGLRGLPEMKTA